MTPSPGRVDVTVRQVLKTCRGVPCVPEWPGPFGLKFGSCGDGRVAAGNFPGGGVMKRLERLMSLGAVCLALSGVACPQASSTSLRGTVTDSSGSAIGGATVVIDNAESRIARSATSGDGGEYRFLSLPPGTYTLTVTSAGFTRYQQTGIQLLVNTPATANVQLKVGGTNESVTI